MENRARPLKTTENRRGSIMKFKPIKPQYNELQSKYEIYKNGTPNNYQQNVENLKAYHIKNNIKTLQLPAIDYVLQELKNIPENTGTNLRDFSIHPSMMQKYGNKFRTLISDSQQIKDFMQWFQKKENQIVTKNCGITQKFYLNQSLIASGFNEMLTQISFVSKLRAEVLRTLWNKQNCEVQQLFNYMHKQNSESQKKNLQTLKVTHLSYQQQIIGLRNDNYCGQKKLEQAVILNESCINSLRTTRKQIKKYQKIIKQLTDSNYTLKQQSLHILEQNIKLIMRDRNLPFDKARILAYQNLQARSIRRALNGNRKAKNIFKDVKSKAESIVQNKQVPDLQQKKQKLVKYILKRMKQNPGQKNFIMKNQLSDQEDEQIVLEEKIQEMIKFKQIKSEINAKIPKPVNFFNEKAINTQPIEFSVAPMLKQIKLETVGVQTISNNSQIPNITLFDSFKSQEVQGKKILQKKKIEQRHTLMMIQMNKMMQFKRLDGSVRAKRFTPVGKMIQSSRFSKVSRFSSQDSRKLNIQEIQQTENITLDDLQENIPKDQSQRQQKSELKNRQANIMRRHHQSLIAQKSYQFKQMIETISKDLEQQKAQKQLTSREPTTLKLDEADEKILQLKQLVIKYMQKKGIQKQLTSNPEKQLKKILSHTFKNLFVSKKWNFLRQLIRTAKNSFGNVIYQNKLVHLISMIIENKQMSLLGALNILMAISTSSESYPQVNYQDVNEIYFKLYFYLSTKSPIENQFNIWSNYTTVQKINNASFTQILKLYFSESKCMYLQLKIREFIGVSREQEHQNNYYVKLNPLMMYILEVYLLEKQNYYESYHQIIDFLSSSQFMSLETFVFLLDLLCFKEQQQKDIIKSYLKQEKQQHNIPYFNKDLFYRICVKFQVPLFQFIKILKLQQFKKLHECLQTQFAEIGEYEKWTRTRENIEKALKMKGLYKSNIKNIISKMEKSIKENGPQNNQALLFFYRIVMQTAFSC